MIHPAWLGWFAPIAASRGQPRRAAALLAVRGLRPGRDRRTPRSRVGVGRRPIVGVAGTGTLGDETVIAEANTSVTGNAGTSALGNAITAGAAGTVQIEAQIILFPEVR